MTALRTTIAFNARRLFWSMAILAVFLMIGTPQAHAAPNGSWQKSCSQQVIDTTNKVVKGYCGKGSWPSSSRHSTLIRYDLCAGDISNDHGHLKCTRLAANSWGIPLSAGKTCINGFTVDGRYYAKCKRKTDSWTWTSTPVGPCNSAANADGNLSCSAAYAQGGSSSGGSGGGFPYKSFALCYTHYGFRQTVSGSGYTVEEAIANFKKTLPNGGIGDLVTLGACP